jgi:2-dehydro-3-deoxyphosphogluconate aldolase/(4S)-4-hydroxy-2-oxoglutarate aldolase
LSEDRPQWLRTAGRVIPVVTIDEADHAEPLADALTRGGIACAEITLRTPAGLAAIERLASRDGFAVGAGTVLNATQANAAITAGAAFLVSPGFDDGVWAAGQHAGIPVIPGVATATEAQRAVNAGASTVKFFPAATSGGLPAVKALSAVFTQLSFMPTGGITLDDLGTWLAEPAIVAVGGSWIAPRELLRTGNFNRIEQLARQTTAVLAHLPEASDDAPGRPNR